MVIGQGGVGWCVEVEGNGWSYVLVVDVDFVVFCDVGIVFYQVEVEGGVVVNYLVYVESSVVSLV